MRRGSARAAFPTALLLSLVFFVPACGSAPGSEPDPELASRGAFEITARLDEIRGEFVDRPMYDYAFVMKYTVLEVHRGDLDAKTIYVGHYNPHKPRDKAADARVAAVGGKLERFRAGDVHRMALEASIDEHYMGGIINRYFEEYDGPIYWAVWTNPAAQ